MTTLPTLPVLRRGQPYDSLDVVELASVRSGETVARIGQANAAMIRRDLRRQDRSCLRAIPFADLIAMYPEAGRHFMESTLPVGDAMQSPEDYVSALAASTGLPHALVRRNMTKIHEAFVEIPSILKGLTRGLDLTLLDTGRGMHEGAPVSFFAAADTLAVVLPSNSPGVNTLWMPSIALKVPVVLKPGREEPWTPLRIIQSFVAAGVPAEAFGFYPTDHEGSAALLESCGRALLFGDQSTVDRYAGNPGVQVHGPGWSKVLIGEDVVDRWPEFIDVIAASIGANSGRSCVNASAVLVPRHGAAIADAVAERLSTMVPKAPDDPSAELSGFANPAMAERMDQAIESGLAVPGARNASAPWQSGGRRIERDGSTYLLPTIVHCASWDHPLANREFLFPYASVVEMSSGEMLEKMGPSLVVTAITHDSRLLDALLDSRHVERLNIGPIPTGKLQWDQPHEGNLFEFLYRRRSFSEAPGW